MTHLKAGKLFAAATMLAVTAALTACGGGDGGSNAVSTGGEASPSGGSGETAPETVQIKMLGHATWFVQGMEAIIPEAKKNGFDLVIEKVPEGDDGANLMKTRFATNDKPDILFYQNGISINHGFGVPGDVFVAQDDQPWMENFDKDAWKNLMDTLEDGHWYGAPYGGTDMGMVLYNKKLFQELNLQVPTTMDEFWKVAEALKAAGKTPVYFSGQDAWTVQLPILLSGASRQGAELIPLMNENKAKMTEWTDRKVGMQFIKEAVEKGFANADILSSTYDNAQKALASGEAGMYHMATWVMNEIVTKYPEGVEDIGAFVMPYKGGGQDLAAIWAPKAMYIVKGENQNDAQRFVNWFEQPAVQDVFFAKQGGIPAIKGVKQTSLTPAELDAKKYLDEGRAIANVPYPIKFNSDANLPTYAQELFVEGGKTPDQALEALQKDMEADAKAKGDPNFK
ncbi:ABC transporter substrate-binding protein [Cohnella hongkongensis]|uniref:ABC transporter substrate-binding protein n=1 Tax=Cohnella hongkongensis TaxID=178337 RepID=A0ABV9FJE3_9BACL